MKISGRHAARAWFSRRPDDLVRVYLLEARIRDFSDLLKHCADRRLAYHVVEADELDRVAGTQHHEGICLLARAPRPSLDDVLRGSGATARVLALDGVTNPHNLGALLRTAAHFGVQAILTDGAVDLTPAAHRVAEGGAAYVDVVALDDLAEGLETLQEAGFTVVGTSGRAERSAFAMDWPARTVVVLGSEGHGLSRAVHEILDEEVLIPGTGHVESLNVSAAGAVVLAQLFGAGAPSSARDRGRGRGRGGRGRFEGRGRGGPRRGPRGRGGRGGRGGRRR